MLLWGAGEEGSNGKAHFLWLKGQSLGLQEDLEIEKNFKEEKAVWEEPENLCRKSS